MRRRKHGGRAERRSLAWGLAALLALALSAAAQGPGDPLAPPLGPLPAPPAGPAPSPAPPVLIPPTAAPPPSAAPSSKPVPRISIRGRFQREPKITSTPVPGTNVTAVIVTGGVSMFVAIPSDKPAGKTKFLDIEADRVVIWTRGNAGQLVGNITSPLGGENDAQEIYMAGNVELRTRTKGEVLTTHGDEIFYDVHREVAVVRKADLEIQNIKLPYPLHMQTDELIQENATTYTTPHARVFSSQLPSDPGLTVDVDSMRMEERTVPKSYLYGLYQPTGPDGKPVMEKQRVFNGWNMITRLDGVPVFYFPYLRGRVEDPLGPLDGFSMGYSRIFGFMLNTTWDVFDLLDLPKLEGTRWRLFLDYMSLRGVGYGTNLDFSGKNPLGIQGKYTGEAKLYGINDYGTDLLGGGRGTIEHWPDAVTTWPVQQPAFRGWAIGRANVQELPDGFSTMGQFGFVSDRNFVEQYYYSTQLNQPNLSTFAQIKQQNDNWAWTLYSEVLTRDWLTDTNWLPRADGYLLGQTFSLGAWEDFIVSNTHAQGGYAQLMPTKQVPFAYLPMDTRVNTARFDLMQDFSAPFYLADLKVTPYVIGDAAYYSQDVNGSSIGRAYGGAGIRWNLPLSRLFSEVQSELFNLDGLYHKINLRGNYYASQSSTSLTNLPQLDRFNDDATDQALRDIRPLQTLYNPGYATYLTTNQIFTPQNYALRRLIMNTPDALDTMNVLQLGIDQRLQTKRGFPGNEHVVDWMIFNVGVSIFPHSLRDNFGHTFGIAQYQWLWNIGDRTALLSSGWFEPWHDGPDQFDFGISTQRPDLTTFYLGYREIDPVRSKAVVGNVVFPFSAKYALAASTVWDFGNDVRTYTFYISRMGTDMLFNFGLTYNSTLNTFGVTLEFLPNVARRASRANNFFPAPITNLDPMMNVR